MVLACGVFGRGWLWVWVFCWFFAIPSLFEFFLRIFLVGPCQRSGRLWSGFSAVDMLATCPVLCLCRSLSWMLLLVWPLQALPSGSAVVLARLFFVMPLVLVVFLFLERSCQWSGRLMSGFTAANLLAPCPVLLLRWYLSGLLGLVCPLLGITSCLEVVLDSPCVVMPLVCPFHSSLPLLEH